MIIDIKYFLLFMQILFLVVALNGKNVSLFLHELLYFRVIFLTLETTIHTLCIIVNIILQFIYIEAMPYIVGLHFVLMFAIYGFFIIKAKKKHFERIKEIIVTNDLFYCDSREIRNYIIEEYGYVYSIGDIEKCIFKMDQ